MSATALTNPAEKTILRSLLKLAIPIMGVQLLQAGYQLTDAYWVGKLGANAVAAVSVNFPINFLFLSLGSGFAVAGSIMVAHHSGAGKRDRVNHVATQTLMMILLVSTLLTLISLGLSSPILSFLGVGKDIFHDALSFLRLTLSGIPVTFIFIMFQGVMRGVGKVSIPLIINMVTVTLNFLLDPILIYGWGPVPGHGVEGAAIATLITQILSAIAAIYFLIRGNLGVKLNWRGFVPDWPLIKKAFNLGLPSSVELSLRSLGLSAMFFLITPFGTQIVAVYGIGVRLLTLILIPATGMSQACTTLVGQNIGANRMDRAEKISRLAVIISFILLTGIGVLCYLGAPLIVSFFVKDNHSIVTTKSIFFIHLVSLFFGFQGIQQALGGTFKGAGDTVKSMMLSMINGWIIQIPAAILMSKVFHWGYTGVWIASPLSNILTAVLAVYWYYKGNWKNKKVTPSS
jgi:putative MATE family efflux protein